jgi:hypothetical protein
VTTATLWLNFVLAVAAVASAVFAFVQANAAVKAKDAAAASEKRIADANEATARALAEANALTEARVPEQVEVAYRDLMAVMSDLVSHTFLDSTGPGLLRQMRLRMTFLAEQMSSDDAVGPWLDAERQLAMKHAVGATEALANMKYTNEASPEALMEISRPFNEWAAAFTENLRAWRAGLASQEDLIEQAQRIRAILEKTGQWRERRTFGDAP